MPKKLNISSNERVDLEDFNRASTGYTQESDNFDRQKLLLSGRSLVSSGFRIEISDQVTSPGEFTIYNGVAVDKSGNLLNNEQQVADARTLTLSGAGLEFYIEVEYVESESDVDSRAFWDPTFAGNNPPGKEFSLNVATRVTPDWQVVQPVSTSAFSVTGTVNSNRIPIAVLYTNGSNEITGFTAVNASTTLEQDAGAADLTLKVFDSTVFPVTGTATVGGTSVNITANDRTNGILTISPAMGVAKQAGAVVVETGPTAAFLPLDTDAVPGTPSGTESADQRRAIFKADEVRGSALSANPEDAAARSDVQLKSLKDHVDFLSAQLRELKFGSQRSDVEGGVPPSSWANTRYYDAAGSVAGARAATLTVGDGSLSYGDIVTTSSNVAAALQTAHDALDATNGGTVYVKEGDYVWNSTLTVTKPMKVVFGEGVQFVAGTYSGTLTVSNASKLTVEGMPLRSTGAAATRLNFTGNTAGLNLVLKESNFDRLEVVSGLPASSVNIRAERCTFRTSSISVGDHVVDFPNDSTDRVGSVLFEDCTIAYESSSSDSPNVLAYGNQNGIVYRSCTFDAAAGTNSNDGFVFADAASTFDITGWTFDACSFVDTGTSSVERGLTFDGDDTCDTIKFTDCTFDFHYAATPTEQRVISFTTEAAAISPPEAITVSGCDFTAIGTNTIPNTSAGTLGTIIYVDGFAATDGPREVSITGCIFGKPIPSGGTTPTDFVQAVYSDAFSPLRLENNIVKSMVGGFFINDVYSIRVSGNRFENDSDAVAWVGDTFAIRSNSSDIPCLIDGNTIRFEGGTNALTTDECIGIDIIGGINEEWAPVVTNNDVEISLRSGIMIGIQAYATFDDDRILCSSNRITVGNNLISASADVYGIRCSDAGGYQTNSIISDNTINVRNTTAGNGECRGIDCRFARDDEGQAGCTITGNVIVATTGSGGSSIAYGIYFLGVGCVISNNTYNTFNSNVVSGAGIYVEGHSISVVNNRILIEFNCFMSAIWYTSADTSFVGGPGVISLSNNNIVYRGDKGAIEVSIIHNDTNSINVNNNTISWDVPDANTINCINFSDTTVTGGTGCYNVCNNTIHEWLDTFGDPTGNSRSAIQMNMDPTTDAINVSNNSIRSSAHTSLRAANTGAIEITNGNSAICNGNVISGWAGTTVANRASIYIQSVNHIVCNSNFCDYVGVAGESPLRVTSCPSGNVSANELNGDALDATGSTVSTTGSNS